MPQSSRQVSSLSFIEHEYFLEEATELCDMHPDAFRWHYVQMAFKRNNLNVSRTARQLGMHRRTLQRMLDTRPKAKVPA